MVNRMRVVPEIAEGEVFRLKQARAEATRTGLIAAARKLFVEVGYQEAGIAEIVTRAKITRGGLYYHFVEKKDLFEAVILQIVEENQTKLIASIEPLSNNRWLHFVEALKMRLQMIASDPELQRVLVDGPAVLGWERWNEIHTAVAITMIADEMIRMMDLNIIKHLDAEVTAHLILALLNEASLTIAHAADQSRALRLAIESVMALVDGLRA